MDHYVVALPSIYDHGGEESFDMAEFKAGDVVRVSPLKGPWMIVESCDGANAVCFWFDKNDAGHRETFAAALLEAKKSEATGISGFTRHSQRE
jgi:uncharacterized protein YodC (DUF2158 family)